ncbi:hypothetical protein BAE44_0001997, partial [Dichanthelium oligosanthes]
QILGLSSVGSQERTSDSPCHVVLIVWVFFCLVSTKFQEIPRYVSVLEENGSPLRKGSWFGY